MGSGASRRAAAQDKSLPFNGTRQGSSALKRISPQNDGGNSDSYQAGVQTFDMVTLSDGTFLMTRVDDESGCRLFVDWATQEWRPLEPQVSAAVTMPAVTPDLAATTVFGEIDSALSQRSVQEATATTTAVAATAPQISAVAALPQGGRAGIFVHKTRGVLSTYVRETRMNIRHYFDEDRGEWIRMPLSWEAREPSVERAVAQIQSVFPHAYTSDVIILGLREHNYSVEETVNWMMDDQAQRPSGGGDYNGSSSGNGNDNSISGRSSVVQQAQIDQLAARVSASEQALREKTEELRTSEASRLRLMSQIRAVNQGFTRQATSLDARVLSLAEELAVERSKADQLELELGVRRRASVARDSGLILSKESIIAGENNTSYEQMRLQQQKEITDLRSQVKSLEAAAAASVTSSGGGSEGDNTAKLERISVKTLRDEHERLRQEVISAFADCSSLIGRTAVAAEEAAMQTNPLRAELEDLRTRYRLEVLQRKMLFNQVQELRGNIRVFCRVRRDTRGTSVVDAPSQVDVTVQNGNSRSTFTFDRCFGPRASQINVFEDTQPLITSVLDGFNVCILAYGQTGAGKTHTMAGPKSDPGVNQRAIAELMSLREKKFDELCTTLRVSMMEVYNETVVDLLDPGSKPKRVLAHAEAGRNVAGLQEVAVESVADVEEVMATGESNRSVAATNMNARSSRSHLLVTIFVESENKVTRARSRSKLTLVDLAGSERVLRSEAKGARLVEAAAINKSLSALGQVFAALHGNAMHVPYRNSKLTHILQDSLGGDAKAMIFLAVSPLQDNINETLSTLKFGSAIRRIELGPIRRH